LKDEDAVVGCVAWVSAAKGFGFEPSDGDEVVATGHVSHYPPQGRTQLYVTDLKPVGAGALQVKFEALCAELREAGYFEDERKRALPGFPKRVAVITSKTGAAVQDVIATAGQRCKAVGLLVVDVRVQGDEAAAEVARAMRWVNERREALGVEAILVTRGGGSQEDLWTFNERVVAEATFESELPVVAAIGHESDTTVIELVADVRAATPTQAAMRLVPSAEELGQQIDHVEDRLGFLTKRMVDRSRERLERAVEREAWRNPAALVQRARERVEGMARTLAGDARRMVAEARARVESLASRLERMRPGAILDERRVRVAVLEQRLEDAGRRHLMVSRSRVEGLARELAAVDPRNVLGRGYSYTTTVDGRLVRSVGDARAGDRLVTNVKDGAIESVVTPRTPTSFQRADAADSADLTSASPLPSGRGRQKRRRDRAGGDGADQMDLFGKGQ